jgi:hypothetical protein
LAPTITATSTPEIEYSDPTLLSFTVDCSGTAVGTFDPETVIGDPLLDRVGALILGMPGFVALPGDAAYLSPGQERVVFELDTSRWSEFDYVRVSIALRDRVLDWTSVRCGPQLTLSKIKSKYNGVVEAQLSGFQPNSSVTLLWPDKSELATGSTDDSGRATLSFRTPLVPFGEYVITATGPKAQATAPLSVIPRIMLAPTYSGPVGTEFRVYLYGFSAGERVEVRWYDAGGATYRALKTVTIAENGRASTLVEVPANSAIGSHTIRGSVVGKSRSASTTFIVTEPAVPGVVSLSKTKSKYNGVIGVGLSTFTPNRVITLRWPDGTVLATVTADGNGSAVTSFRTPLAPYGTYSIEGRDSAGRIGNAELSVIPRIMLAPEDSGPVGYRFRVYFYGFSAGEQVQIQWYDTNGTSYHVLKTVSIADNGRGTSLVYVPTGAALGDHMIRGKVIGVNRSASTKFVVTLPPPSIQLSPNQSKCGFDVFIGATLAGFEPNSIVSVSFDWWPTYSSDGTLTTVKTDSDGNASASFKMPCGPYGDHTVIASDTTGRQASATLRVMRTLAVSTYRPGEGRVGSPDPYGPAGTELHLYASGLLPDKEIEWRWYASDGSYNVMDVTYLIEGPSYHHTRLDGTSDARYFIPDSTLVGDYTIRVVELDGEGYASAPFTVTTVATGIEPTATTTPEPTATAIPEPTETPSPTEVPTETPVPDASPVPVDLPAA